MQGSNSPGFQRQLTAFFVLGYFVLIFAFIGIGAALVVYPDVAFTDDVKDVLSWAQTILAMLIGLLTGALKDQLQYHYGSSVGSKMKDEAKASNPN